MLAAGDEVPGRKRGRPPGPRVDRAARREAVIDAAELEIGEHGSEFGLSGVGERMGYARSALYAVFDRRDDLLDAVAARHAGRLTIEMAAVLAGVDGGRERTQLVVEVVIGWVERHRRGLEGGGERTGVRLDPVGLDPDVQRLADDARAGAADDVEEAHGVTAG